MERTKLIPAILSLSKEGYSFKRFGSDLIAGIIVGIVALPLSIAFAIASGVNPEQGLYTAIVAGFAISLLSGSRFQIGGPTGAFIVILAGIVAKFGYDGLATATIIAGVLLVAMGIARLGSVIKFIPYPVTVGFTTGIALIIFFTQIKDFLGLTMTEVPAEFLPKIVEYAKHIQTVNWWALGIGAVSIAIIVFFPKITYKIPGSLVAIILSTIAVKVFEIPVETIGSRFGSVPNNLPMPRLPHLSWELFVQMFPSGLSIALLAGIESLLSAVVADGMTGTKHRSNMELVGQGIANILSPIFGGIPATGAIARTATNIKSGGTSPIAGIVHAITVMLILLFVGPLAAMIPMPTLAAILIVVAYNMSEIRVFKKLLKSPKSDVFVLLTTFALTVFIDLIVAIQTGVVMAAILFMYRMSNVSQTNNITKMLEEEENPDDPKAISKRKVPEGVEVYEISGSFFFGAAEQFKDQMRWIEKKPKALILRMRDVFSVDATGLQALEDVYEKSRKEGTVLILSGVHAQPLYAMEHSKLFERIGKENVFKDIDDALKRASEIVDKL